MATPNEPNFATKPLALLVAELEALDLFGLREAIFEAMAQARAEREAKAVEVEQQAEQDGLPVPPDPLPPPPFLGGGCGDAYADLLIVRGNDPDDPCGVLEEWACSGYDAKAYNLRADEIYAYCIAAWNLLLASEKKTSNLWSWENIAALETDPFWSAYENMRRWAPLGPLLDPEASVILYNGEIVQSSLSVMRQGVCCLQRLNEELERLSAPDVEPPFVPEEESIIDELPDLPRPISTAFTFVAIAVAAAIGFAVFGRLKK
ncbi:MAG TPA: hypothetical protein VFO62_07525 [Candidatus Binatia bacterium]|nr:hypothetical protein [Candidatus Binatia bacterium]